MGIMVLVEKQSYGALNAFNFWGRLISTCATYSVGKDTSKSS